MKIKKMMLGSYQTNCFIVTGEDNRCFIVDPGDNGKKISTYINENELHVDAILLTHGHFDHVGAVEYLYNAYKCDIYCHSDTTTVLRDSKLNLSNFQFPFVIELETKEIIDSTTIAGIEVKWLYLPGHCPGSSMIYLPKENIIFSGDVLFKGSIGRFDFPGSSNFETKQTIDTIRAYDFDAVVYPGHGDSTTIKEEQLHNPYF